MSHRITTSAEGHRDGKRRSFSPSAGHIPTFAGSPAVSTPTDRRDFLKMACTLIVTGAALGQCSGGTTEAIQWWTSISEEERRSKLNALESLRKIRDIFFDGVGPEFNFYSGRVRFEPAAKAHDDWSAIKAIASLFHLDKNPVELSYDQPPDFRTGSVCVGSPATNALSGLFMRCRADNCIRDAHGKHYGLRFKHHVDIPERTVYRKLNDRDVIEPNYQIVETSGNALIHDSHLNKDGAPTDAYLLFSKLPHPSIPERAVAIWAGNIGPGTEAVSLLLGSDSALRSDNMDSLWNFSHEHSFFQVLLKANDIFLDKDKGRHVPGSCEVIKFHPLERMM